MKIIITLLDGSSLHTHSIEAADAEQQRAVAQQAMGFGSPGATVTLGQHTLRATEIRNMAVEHEGSGASSYFGVHL